MKTTIILTSELLKEVKQVLDNADWSFCSGNITDSEKACNYLSTQKWSLNYLKNYFENSADIDFVNELIEYDNIDFVSAFVKEAIPNIAEDRCRKFMWNGKIYSKGWDLRQTGFKLGF